MDKLTLTVAEVARMIGVSNKAIYQRVRRRQIGGWRKMGRSVVFNRQILLNFLENTQRALSSDGTDK